MAAIPARKRERMALALTLPAVFLGMVLAIQVEAQARRATAFVSPYSSQESLHLTPLALALQREQDSLKGELASLRARLGDIQRAAAAAGGEAARLQREIDALQIEAGLTPVRGAGVIVTVDDSKLPPTLNAQSVIPAIVHSTDIVDVLNAGWRAGAQAIAVNDERIVGASACVGATIRINGTLMSPPFRIAMVGPTEQLFGALNDSPELRELKRRQTAFGLGLRIERAGDVVIPAYTGSIRVRYASAR